MTIAGELIELLPERAVWWPATHTLLVADLHWGKLETFTAHGVPLPTGIPLISELDRLAVALQRTGARRLLILGDLIHAREGVTPDVVDIVADWRAHHPAVEMILVRGNHDRHLPLMPAVWQLDDHDDERRRGLMREGPFAFVHEPQSVAGHYTFCGHTHPTAYISGRGDALRLPCFRVGDAVMTLPAFSDFSDGSIVRPAATDRIFAVADDVVVEVPVRAAARMPDPRSNASSSYPPQ
ncbi:MAG: ligase-associated DNA damage response endonuclease PdeM [Planctomycetota bacterium]